MKRIVILILLSITLLTGCTSYKKIQCEYPKVVVPEPIWEPDIDIHYNKDHNVFYLNERSMRNLNIYLIDVHRYVKDSSNTFKLINGN